MQTDTSHFLGCFSPTPPLGLNNTVRLWSPHADPNFDPDPLTHIDELSDAATQNQVNLFFGNH